MCWPRSAQRTSLLQTQQGRCGNGLRRWRRHHADSELFSASYRSGRRISMATTPSWVAANADGRLELFIPGAEIQNNQFTNAQLFHKWQTAPSNGWSDWASLGT